MLKLINKINKPILYNSLIRNNIIYSNNGVNSKLFINQTGITGNTIRLSNGIHHINRYYSMSFKNIRKEESELIKLIENEPNNYKHYESLLSIIGPHGKSKIGNKEVSPLDLILKVIDIEPTLQGVFYTLYVIMVKSNGDGIEIQNITLLNGKTMDLKQILLKEISNNPSSSEVYLRLSKHLDDKIKETVNINGKEFDKLLCLQVAYAINKNDPFALECLFNYMDENKIMFYNLNEIISIKEIAIQNYCINKEKTSSSVKGLIKYCSESNGNTIIKLPNGKTVTPKSAILENIQYHKTNPELYFYLAKLLVNNYEIVTVDLKTNEIKPYKTNRIELMKTSIEYKLKEIKHYRNNNNGGEIVNMVIINELLSTLSFAYHCLATFIDNDESITFFSEPGKPYTKNQLFIKSIEINPKPFLKGRQDLAENMYYNENEIINGISLSRIEMSNSIISPLATDEISRKFNIIGYSLLSKYYKQDNNIEKSLYYQQLLSNEKHNFKYEIIEYIKSSNDKNDTLYQLLSLQMDENEKLLVNGKMMNKKDLLLKAIQIEPLNPLNYYELSKLLKDPTSTITILHGVLVTKTDLLLISLKSDPTNSDAFYSLSLFADDSHTAIELLKSTLTFNPKHSEAYLKLGILMKQNSIDNIVIEQSKEFSLTDTDDQGEFNMSIKNQKIEYLNRDSFKLSRKDCFIKSIVYLNQLEPFVINQDSKLAYHHLTLEMKDNEIQFFRTKDEILSEIKKLN